jgi:DNA-directed RNA polymerase specialized sigma24 family protein
MPVRGLFRLLRRARDTGLRVGTAVPALPTCASDPAHRSAAQRKEIPSDLSLDAPTLAQAMDGGAGNVPIEARRSEEPTMALPSRELRHDPAEAVARIAHARRDRMLRIHRRRLRWEDLEDCYSQATLELVTRSRRSPFTSIAHVQNALEQKFLSRIEDKRRAVGGRSSIEAAIARSLPVDSPEYAASELEDRRAAVEQQVIARTELHRVREVIGDLTRDQQLVLASQVCVDMGVSEFCAQYGWSVEKYRKVAQRARGKLRILVEEYERGGRCVRLERDILAMHAGLAEGRDLARARAHVANCRACAHIARETDRSRSIAAIVPFPLALAGSALWSKLSGILSAARRAVAVARHPLTEIGYSGVGATSSSVAGLGALKVGLAVVCVAGAAGSYAVCAHLGVVPPLGFAPHPHRVTRSRPVHTSSTRAAANRSPSVAVTAPAPRVEPQRTHSTVLAQTSGSSTMRPVHHRVSAIAQTRREFGGPVAKSAESTPTASTPSPAADPKSAPPSVSTAQTRQTQAEFGFER